MEAVVLLPSDGLIATAGGNSVKFWDLIGGGKCVHSMESHNKTVTSICVGKVVKASGEESDPEEFEEAQVVEKEAEVKKKPAEAKKSSRARKSETSSDPEFESKPKKKLKKAGSRPIFAEFVDTGISSDGLLRLAESNKMMKGVATQLSDTSIMPSPTFMWRFKVLLFFLWVYVVASCVKLTDWMGFCNEDECRPERPISVRGISVL